MVTTEFFFSFANSLAWAIAASASGSIKADHWPKKIRLVSGSTALAGLVKIMHPSISTDDNLRELRIHPHSM
jgi:hypothetical protein